MSNKKDLNKLLNLPQPEKDLESKIKANWRKQLSNEKPYYNRGFWAAAASIVFAIVIFVGIDNTPKVVYAALTDISHDAKHDIGLSIDLENIQNKFGINPPPQSMPIKMTKYCTLNGTQTVHMQITGENQGEVHVFMQQGDFDSRSWQERDGELQAMPWKLMQTQNGLSVLVIHSKDMNLENVKLLTQKMFYS